LLSSNQLVSSKILKIDRERHLANRNEIRLPGSTTATNVAVAVLYSTALYLFYAEQNNGLVRNILAVVAELVGHEYQRLFTGKHAGSINGTITEYECGERLHFTTLVYIDGWVIMGKCRQHSA